MAQDTHPAALPIDELLAHCRVIRQRRSGPGGQHRNKVETAIMIEHLPSGTRAEASERRSQEQNRRMGVHRLRIQLALNVRCGNDRSAVYVPSPRWRARLSGTQFSVSTGHEDFPALLAEALDVSAARAWDLSQAAADLGTSASQLVKMLKQEPAALAHVNKHRRRMGEVTYK